MLSYVGIDAKVNDRKCMNDKLLSTWNEVTVAYSNGANLAFTLGD